MFYTAMPVWDYFPGGVRSNDHLHRHEPQNRAVASKSFMWLIRLCLGTIGDFAPFALVMPPIFVD